MESEQGPNPKSEATLVPGFYVTGSPSIVYTTKEDQPVITGISRCRVPTRRTPARLKVLLDVDGHAHICIELLIPRIEGPEGVLQPVDFLLISDLTRPVKLKKGTFLVQEGMEEHDAAETACTPFAEIASLTRLRIQQTLQKFFGFMLSGLATRETIPLSSKSRSAMFVT